MRHVRQAIRRTFRSLGIRNYRLYFIGQLISVSGTWMQTMAQDWLVLRLTDRAVPLGIATALQFGPLLLLGAWGGLLADRSDKRKVLIATQAAFGLQALVLGLLVLAGMAELWHVYLMAFLFGCTTAVDMPARQAFVSELVGPDRLVNAVGLNSALFNSARMVGPALGAVVVAGAGLAPAFLANAASYLAVIVGLALINPGELYLNERAPASRGQVREGLRYVWRTPVLRSTILLVAVIGTLAMNQRVILPLLARFTFNGGPEAYGMLASVLAAGSVAGALATAARQRPSRRLMLGAATALGLTSLIAAAAPTLALATVALIPVGVTTMLFLATANTTLQLNSDPSMRGRVMALYGLVFLGAAPAGGMLTSWLAEHFGARSGLVLAGAGALSAVLLAVLGGRRRARAAPAPAEPEVEPARTG